MIYEFRYGGYTYDCKTAEELPSAVKVKEHAEAVRRKYDLPYVTVSERVL